MSVEATPLPTEDGQTRPFPPAQPPAMCPPPRDESCRAQGSGNQDHVPARSPGRCPRRSRPLQGRGETTCKLDSLIFWKVLLIF